MILLSSITFSYNRASSKVINNCSVVFNSPGRYIIVGENGSGKSTLMDILTGFKKPALGFVVINGVDLYSSNKAITRLRTLASYMPASLRLPAHLDVSYIFDLWMGGYFRDELIRDLNLTPFLNYRYSDLSDGYRTRVNLAIALSRGAFIFLDEPLRSQDEGLCYMFPDLISKYTSGKTLIITSPNIINGVEWDMIFNLKAGRLDERI